MMRIARHRLQIAVSLIDIVQAVRREDRPDLLRITFSSEENRPGVWLRGNGLNRLLSWLRRICFRAASHGAALYWIQTRASTNNPLVPVYWDRPAKGFDFYASR